MVNGKKEIEQQFDCPHCQQNWDMIHKAGFEVNQHAWVYHNEVLVLSIVDRILEQPDLFTADVLDWAMETLNVRN